MGQSSQLPKQNYHFLNTSLSLINPQAKKETLLSIRKPNSFQLADCTSESSAVRIYLQDFIDAKK